MVCLFVFVGFVLFVVAAAVVVVVVVLRYNHLEHSSHRIYTQGYG